MGDSRPNPRAVLLARAFLAFAGTLALLLGSISLLGGDGGRSWWLLAVFALGIGLLLSAVLERPAAVVSTFLLFFFPWA